MAEVIASSRSDRAYEGIKQEILTRNLKPGSPIIETDFAEKLKMSRTPVREAIRRLYAEGLVDIIPMKGAYIRTFSKRDMLMCFEAAEGLEGMVAFLVAKSVAVGRADKRWLSELDEIIKRMDETLADGDIQGWAYGDERFHHLLYRMCENEYVVQSLDRIRVQLNYALWFLTPFYIDKKTSNEEHHHIIEAIRTGDAERARSLSQVHRDRVKNELEKHVPDYVF